MTALRILFFAQLAFMLPAFVAFIAQPAYLGTLYLLVYVLGLGLVTGAFAAWQAWRNPSARKLALASGVTTLVCLSTPFVFQALELAPVPIAIIILAAIVLTLLAAALLLANRNRWQPGKVFMGRGFNTAMLIAIAVALAIIWVPPVIWLSTGQGAELGESRSADNALRGDFLIYYLSISLPALIVMIFSLIFAVVALIRSTGSKLIHAAQLAGSLMLLGSLGLVAGGLAIAMVNPG